jgi:riboflavin transporter FmnP
MTNLTISFIVGIIFLIVVYDIWALKKSTKTEYTISYVIAKTSLKNPIIAFAFGMLMGHFFWAQCVL